MTSLSTKPWNIKENINISHKEHLYNKQSGKILQKSIFKKKIYFSNNIIFARFNKSLDQPFKWIKKLKLTDNCVILDVGANVGINSICYKKIFKKSKIYSFEPIKNTFKILKKNIKRNKLNGSIKTFNFGFSNKNKKAFMSIPTAQQGERYKHYLSSALYSLYGKGKKKIKTKLLTIDKFVKDHKIKRIDFIKIDVEGHEYEILEGAKNSIKKFKPIIQSEFNYITRLLSKKNYKNYLEFAKKYNYRIMLLGKGYKIINKPNLNKISKYKFSDFIFF
tara:strand:+ start:768 stop:1598 length:831 start_codon:yes stop_codon:yes gene_type:complete